MFVVRVCGVCVCLDYVFAIVVQTMIKKEGETVAILSLNVDVQSAILAS